MQIKTTLAIAATLTALAAPAFACRPLETVLQEYHDQYGERPLWMGNSTGVRNDGATMVIIAAPDGSWTLLKVERGNACHIDHGYDSELFQRRGVRS